MYSARTVMSSLLIVVAYNFPVLQNHGAERNLFPFLCKKMRLGIEKLRCLLECRDSISKLLLKTSITRNCTTLSSSLLKKLHTNFERAATESC